MAWIESVLFLKCGNVQRWKWRLECLDLPTAFQVVLVVWNPPATAGDAGDIGSVPGLGRCPWSRKLQHTPVLVPEKFHGQRYLASSMGSQSQIQLSDWTQSRDLSLFRTASGYRIKIHVFEVFSIHDSKGIYHTYPSAELPLLLTVGTRV